MPGFDPGLRGYTASMATDEDATTTGEDVEEDHGSTGGKLREVFGTGSLTSGKVTGGTGGAGNIVDGDVNTGGDEGVDTTGAGPLHGTD